MASKELRFAELRDQIADLTARCAAQDGALSIAAGQFDELSMEFSASSSSEQQLQSALQLQKEMLANLKNVHCL